MLIVIGLGIFVVGNFLYIHGSNLFFLAVLLVLVACLFLFAALNIGVDRESVSIRFGVGLIRKEFLVRDIESHGIVRNPWYYGWGIRRTPDGWLYNVSGFSAVELCMKDGKKYRIGTDDPVGLNNAVEQALFGSSG